MAGSPAKPLVTLGTDPMTERLVMAIRQLEPHSPVDFSEEELLGRRADAVLLRQDSREASCEERRLTLRRPPLAPQSNDCAREPSRSLGRARVGGALCRPPPPHARAARPVIRIPLGRALRHARQMAIGSATGISMASRSSRRCVRHTGSVAVAAEGEGSRDDAQAAESTAGPTLRREGRRLRELIAECGADARKIGARKPVDGSPGSVARQSLNCRPAPPHGPEFASRRGEVMQSVYNFHSGLRRVGRL